MPTLPSVPQQSNPYDDEVRRIEEAGERQRAMMHMEWTRARDERVRQVEQRDAGNPWEHEPSSGEFWGRVAANAGRPEPADVTAARDREGFRAPRIPEVDLTLAPVERRQAAPARPVAPSVGTAWRTTVQPAPAAPPPAPAPAARASAPLWSATTIEEGDLPPATPATAPQPERTPLADDDKYPLTMGRAPMPDGRSAPSRAQAPAAMSAPADAAESAVDRQIQMQGDRRRRLSERELRNIRASISQLPPETAPTFNPLQAYSRLWRDVPAGERARDSIIDQLLGYHYRNRVTAREIIEDVDSQLAERRRPSQPSIPADAPTPAQQPSDAETDSPIDRQAAAQGIPRRTLSFETLLETRAALKTQPPDEAPRKSPLQGYPMTGRFDIPEEDRIATRPGTGADLFGHQPRNRVTNKELLADVERQLEAWRKRMGMSAETFRKILQKAEETDRRLREDAKRRYPDQAPQR